jgi:hypothetical protein
MTTDVSRSRGRFWAIRDISGNEDCSDLEEAEAAEATPLPTFGDTLRWANDLRDPAGLTRTSRHGMWRSRRDSGDAEHC